VNHRFYVLIEQLKDRPKGQFVDLGATHNYASAFNSKFDELALAHFKDRVEALKRQHSNDMVSNPHLYRKANAPAAAKQTTVQQKRRHFLEK